MTSRRKRRSEPQRCSWRAQGEWDGGAETQPPRARLGRSVGSRTYVSEHPDPQLAAGLSSLPGVVARGVRPRRLLLGGPPKSVRSRRRRGQGACFGQSVEQLKGRPEWPQRWPGRALRRVRLRVQPPACSPRGARTCPLRWPGLEAAEALPHLETSPKARSSPTLPYLTSGCSAWAGVAQTPLWSFGSWGGRGKHVSGKTRAQEVCGKRAQLVNGWKLCSPSGRAGGSAHNTTHTHTHTHTHTRWEGVKPTAGSFLHLQKRKYEA